MEAKIRWHAKKLKVQGDRERVAAWEKINQETLRVEVVLNETALEERLDELEAKCGQVHSDLVEKENELVNWMREFTEESASICRGN